MTRTNIEFYGFFLFYFISFVVYLIYMYSIGFPYPQNIDYLLIRDTIIYL